MIKELTSRENPRVKYAYSLKSTKGRKENKQFLAEGRKALELALEAGLVTDVFTLEEIPNLPETINQYVCKQDIIEKIAYSMNPEGIVFISNFVSDKKPAKMNKVVYLDHINDPGNMGTIIRTALAFSYDVIVISEGSVSIYNEKVVAATKGAIYLLPILEGSIKDFDSSYKVIVSTLNDKSVDLEKAEKVDKFVLVLGNEAHGVSNESIERADLMVKIPVANIDSLNVSVAAGILMNHLR